MTGSRPGGPGAMRVCPHCKAGILESAAVCPACRHHLRFDPRAAAKNPAGDSAFKVEGSIRHPPEGEPWEYSMVLSIRNDRGEEIARQVVGVGALRANEERTFTVAVEVFRPA